MRHSLSAGALLLMVFALSRGAQVPPGYDTPPSQIEVERPGFPYDFGEYGVAMDDREPVVLVCRAEGRPAPTYRWEKDGSPVDTSDPRITIVGGRLQVNMPTIDDEGEWQCFAENAHGTALSPKYQTVFAFQEQFDGVGRIVWKFTEGEEGLMSCGAPDGAPTPRVYWNDQEFDDVKTDNRIAYTDNGDLYFSNIVDSDQGGYYCLAANDLLGTYMRSAAHVLKVESGAGDPRAATIKFLPTNMEGLRTEKFTIKCLASGFPTPEISWYKDEAEVATDRRVKLDDNNQVLSFRALSFEDAGTYECRASNEANTEPAKKTVHLTVASAPYFSVAPADMVIAPGAEELLECNPGGVPEPTVTWLQNGAPIVDVEGSPYEVMGNTVTINDPREGESTVFQCVLNNIHGEKIGSYTITVLAIPATITAPPKAREVQPEGGVVSLGCVAFGSPMPTIQWHKDEVELEDGGRIIINSEESSGTLSSTLNVTELVFTDGGEYTCHALNMVGNSSASSNVLVRFPTSASLEPKTQYVEKDNSAEFTCEVVKDPLAMPDTTWFLNDAEIHPNQGGGDFSLSNGNVLRVLSAKASHTGTFKCVVTTKYDEAFSTAELTVRAEPDPPYNVEVEVVGLQATLNWVEPASNNAAITTYTIEWRTQHDSFPRPMEPDLAPWDVVNEISASSTSETVELGNYLMYTFRVIATNEVGDSRRSEEVTGPMTPAAPPDVNSMPGNVRSEANEPGKLTVSWDEVHPNYHNGPDFAYVIRWRQPGGEWQETVIDDPSTTSFEIEGEEYENIEFTVGVQNSEDTGPDPPKSIATTGQGKPSAAPSNVQLTTLGSNQINVTWDPVPPADLNGALSHYMIYYTMQAALNGEHAEKCEGNVTSCVVGGLEAHTTYEVSMSVANELLEGPRSPPVTIKTEEGVPTAPENLKVDSTSYRVAVSWSPPAQENGVHLGYHLLIVGSQGNDIVKEANETIDDKDQLSFKLEEAKPDTSYEVTLTAYTRVGDSPPVKGSSTTGAAGAPPNPGAPELEKAGEKDLNVTWPGVGEGAAKPDEVRACFKVEGGEEDCEYTPWVDVFDKEKIHVNPLDSGTEYVVFLEQRNKEGLGTGPVDTFATLGAGASKKEGGPLAPWFIAIICVIILLLLILLIICILKSQKGGKYNVSDKEKQLQGENAPLKNNEGFQEFNKDSEFPDEDGSQDSLASNPDEDGDSLKEYADDEDPSKFNEDGSFVEEYHDPKPRSTDTREGGTSTFV